MPDTMRGVYTNLTEIRRKVFCEVARVAYMQGDATADWADQLPYTIIPGEQATYRESIFLERAIVGARIRLAMGLNLLDAGHFPTEHVVCPRLVQWLTGRFPSVDVRLSQVHREIYSAV